MKKLIFIIIVSFLVFNPLPAKAVELTLSPTTGPTLSDIGIVFFSRCFDWCFLGLYKSDGSYVAGPKWIYTGSAPSQSDLNSGTQTIADLGFAANELGDYILLAYRDGSYGCTTGGTLEECLTQTAFEANTAAFTLGISVTLTPSPTPTISPTPTPTPDANTPILQSILSETQLIRGFISDIINKLATIISNMANLATENTLGLIKIKTDNLDTLLSSRASESTLSGIKLQTDKFSFDPSNYLKVTGTLSSAWETGAALGHGFILTTDNIVLPNKNENPVLLIQNPSSSGKTIKLRKVLFGASDKASATARIYKNPFVISTGTSLTINSLSSSGFSATQGFKSPSVSANGVEQDSVRFTSSGREISYDLGFYLVPGEKLLITPQLDASDAGDTVSMTWLEE